MEVLQTAQLVAACAKEMVYPVQNHASAAIHVTILTTVWEERAEDSEGDKEP